MSFEDKDERLLPSMRSYGQEWLMEYPGALALTQVRIDDAKADAVKITEHDKSFGYVSSTTKWVARDRVRFVQRLA